MKNKILLWIALIVVVLVVAGLFLVYLKGRGAPPPVKPAIATSEAQAVLPKVITLYQKGEGESDLAAFVSKELSRSERKLAKFMIVNILDEPQMADYYGVSSMPSVIFITTAGRVFRKHTGYLDKAKILAILKAMARD